MRAEQGESHFDGLTTPALARSVGFRQMLGLVGRPCRFQAVLDKFVRDAGPLQIYGAGLFLDFGKGNVADRNVGVDLVDDIARHPEFGGFRPLRGTFL